MLNSIWFGMIALSVVCALMTGRLGELSSAVMDGAQTAVELSIFLLGSMCAWLGFLKIAEESGLSRLLAQALSPIIGRLFPEYREDEEIQGKISMNLSANLLGLGNAATPLGLAAMKSMAEKNTTDSPTKGMILFVEGMRGDAYAGASARGGGKPPEPGTIGAKETGEAALYSVPQASDADRPRTRGRWRTTCSPSWAWTRPTTVA